MSELTDKMRTCAAYILAKQENGDPWATHMVALDAVALLIEASNALEQRGESRFPLGEALGEPMETLKPVNPQTTAWTGGDPAAIRTSPHNPHACPKCDSRAAKTVRREGRSLMLVCPVCGTTWPWKPRAEWR